MFDSKHVTVFLVVVTVGQKIVVRGLLQPCNIIFVWGGDHTLVVPSAHPLVKFMNSRILKVMHYQRDDED
jgi:hypothetical protein